MTKVLLVEDDKSLREIYGVRLLAEGYDIVSAGDGEEALAMAIKDRPSLIISDVMMPKISGFDMLDILRSTTETKNVKVIMMTALSSDDQRARGEQLGADRYLVKSQVGIEDVVRTVHEVLGDAPTTSQAPTFSSTPAPSAPAPVPMPAPVATTPQPAPQSSDRPATPFVPERQSQAAAAPTPAPASVATPPPTPAPTTASPTSSAPAAASGLPQPTAPFSTNRPSSLGLSDRVINPLPKEPTSGPDVSELISRELSGTSDNAAASTLGISADPAPATPVQTPTPMPTPPPAPVVPTAAPVPTPQPAPSSSSSNTNNPFTSTPSSTPGMNFEETPRPAATGTPAPNPFINNSGRQ